MKNMRVSPAKESRLEIRISGSGGQGVILAGIMLAEAAVLDGNYAAQSQVYGPEARGGSSRCDVVLNGIEIDYPWTLGVDILVALTQQGYHQNIVDLKEDGLVIADSDLVHGVRWNKSLSIPFRHIAIESGEERAINVAALGAVARFCPYVSRASLTRVMARRLPPAKVEISLLAFCKAMERAATAKLCTMDNREEVEI
jgi:2-oxoglutarate ferredoxin oxidoreductase subunit gamma